MSDLTIKEVTRVFNNRNPTNKQIEEYKKWADDGLVYIHKKLALKIIMNCKVPTAIEFRTTLGFNQHDLIMTKVQLGLTKIMKIFAYEKILL